MHNSSILMENIERILCTCICDLCLFFPQSVLQPFSSFFPQLAITRMVPPQEFGPVQCFPVKNGWSGAWVLEVWTQSNPIILYASTGHVK